MTTLESILDRIITCVFTLSAGIIFTMLLFAIADSELPNKQQSMQAELIQALSESNAELIKLRDWKIEEETKTKPETSYMNGFKNGRVLTLREIAKLCRNDMSTLINVVGEGVILSCFYVETKG